MTQFRIVVIVDPTRAVTGTRRVRKELLTLSAAARRVNFELLRAFSIFAGVQVISSAVRVLSEFSLAMATVEAVSQATGNEIVQLTDRAKELGITTRFTATQAAQGMEFLARTGLDAAEVLEAIVPSLRLAQVGNLELARSADIATNVMKGFRLETSELEKVVDILALTTTSSNTSVEQLGQGFKFVAPIAAGLGVSLETTAAALGILSDRGLQAGIAGTGLRRVLAELTEPTGKAVKILRLFGLTAEDISLSSNTLAEALTTMRDAGIGAEEAIAFFGQRGGPAFEVLVNSIPDIIRFSKELENSGGTAKRIADIMDDTLFGALKKVTSAFQGFLLALGVTPGLQTFFEGIATAVRFLANNLDTAGVAALSLILALTGGPILGVIASITGITTATFTLTGALTGALVVARLLGRALVIGFVIEGISAVIDEFKRLDEIVEDTNITWGQAALFAVETFANRIIGGLVFLGGIVVTLASAITDPLVTAFTATGKEIGLFLSDPIKFLQQSPTVIGARIGDAIATSFSTALSEGFDEALGLVDNRFIEFVSDDVFNKGTGTATGRVGEAFASGDKPKSPVENLLSFDSFFVGLIEEGETQRKGLTAIALATDDFNDALRDQLRLSTLNRIEQEATSEVLAFAATLKQKNTPLEESRIQQLIESTIATKKQIDVSKIWVQTIEELTEPLRINAIRMEALTAAQARGDITTAQFTDSIRALKIELLQLDDSGSIFVGLELGLLRVEENLGDLASVASGLVVNSFNRAEDALVKFVTTGKLSFSSLINSMISDLARLAARQALSSIFNIGKTLLGIPSLGGLGAGGSSLVPDFSGAINPVSFADLPNFQHGGSFDVGGSGGTDSQLVQFRASPNERVTIQTPSQQKRSGDIIFKIDARGAERGVEERIVAGIKAAAPFIVSEAVNTSMSETMELLQRRDI